MAHPGDQGDQLHRQHRGRPRHRRDCAAPLLKKVLAGTRRQESDAGLRRRAAREAARHHRALGVPEFRADLPVRLAHPGRAPLSTTSSATRSSHALRQLRVGDPLDAGTDARPGGVEGAFRQGDGPHRAGARRRRPRAVRRQRGASSGPLRTGLVHRAHRDRRPRARKRAPTREEIFGPVVTLQPFDDDEEALALANASSYGLAASVVDQRPAPRASPRRRHATSASSGSIPGSSATCARPSAA